MGRKSKYSNIDDESIISAISNTITMAEAARKLDMDFRSFRNRAKALGVYSPNQGKKGIDLGENRYRAPNKFSLEEILSNKRPYQSFKLKLRLIAEGLKENQCEICGISEWNDQPLNCQLDHIDGNKNNNNLENLRIICPNCHSQTETFGFKNGRKYWLN